MKLRPTIFLSGVSSEFGSFREAVEVEVQKKRCFAENQSSFGVDYHTVEEMLRRRINDADAVIHIVGFRFGAEPKDRPPNKPRRSYTQMEYDIARELEKPLYVFLSSDASIADTLSTDDAEAKALQLAHRQQIQNSNPLFYFFKDKAELCKLAGEIDAVAHADFRVDISRIDKYAPAELIGREDELALLNDAWLKVRRAEPKRPHLLTFVALGGEGKTSLVAKWLADLAFQNWPGCDSAFAWSFYSQGTREQYAASSDLFLKEAITFFGDEADKKFAASAAGAYEKGQRLARIVSQRASLLILDGLEPLQYAPSSPTRSELKDAGLISLLKGLAASSDGLCLVTTRYSIPNLKAFWQTTAPEVELQRLSVDAGVFMLKTLGVRGTVNEFERLVEEVKGHALTLNLLGTYLRDAHGGDIRRRNFVEFEEADAEEHGGHAFRVMAAYERAFRAEGEQGERALAILRLLGLFDRPITADCLGALMERPIITGLTKPLSALNEAQRNLAFSRLEAANLLTVNRESSGTLISLDAHPLLREYFAQQVRTQQPDTWRAAHHRLYEHLTATTPDKDEPTLEDLQPLYQAVSHGCYAGLQQEVCELVYRDRILRGKKHYTWNQLGAFGSELGAQACFFDIPWSQPSSKISEEAHAWLLNEAGTCLGVSGRLKEAIEPLRATLLMGITKENWESASPRANNLSQMTLTLGDVAGALRYADQSVTYADRSDDPFYRIMNRCAHGTALNDAGRRGEAKKRFREAEQMLVQNNPDLPFLFGLGGFQYCDLLLVKHELCSWRRILKYGRISRQGKDLAAISQRPKQAIELAKKQNSLLSIALDLLTLSRVSLYTTILSSKGSRFYIEPWKSSVDDPVNGVRHSGNMYFLPSSLLTRAWLRFLGEARIGRESAQEDLNEAWEIAERGPMKLQMADIHLYRARLFFREKKYPWESPQADLEAAEKLINECGYHRRDEELADAKHVILGSA